MTAPPSLRRTPTTGSAGVLAAVLRTASLSFEPTGAGIERGSTAWTSTSRRPHLVPAGPGG